MKIFKLLIISSLAALVGGCSEKEPEAEADFKNMGVAIAVRNSLNENLLDPAISGHYNSSDVKVLYLENGQLVEPFFPESNEKYAFDIKKFEPNGQYYMNIRLNPNTPSKTFIKWSENDIDTIECSLIKTESVLVANTISWNGVVKFRNNDPNTPSNWGINAFGKFFEVEK